jgi:hypothetical protein
MGLETSTGKCHWCGQGASLIYGVVWSGWCGVVWCGQGASLIYAGPWAHGVGYVKQQMLARAVLLSLVQASFCWAHGTHGAGGTRVVHMG